MGKLNRRFLFLILLSLFLCSCNFNTHISKEKIYTFTVDFEGGAQPSVLIKKSGRYGLPSVDESNIKYSAQIKSGESVVSNATAEGPNPSFEFKNSGTGPWNIEVTGYNGSVADSNKIFFGTSTFSSSDKDTSVLLKPLKTGTGNISLPVSVAADTGITKCIVTGIGNTPVEIDLSSNKSGTYTKSAVTSKSYQLEFSFRNNSDEVVYWFTETVNVFDNLTTDTWIFGGNSAIGTNGNVTITKDQVAKFSKNSITTFYVGTNNNTGAEPDGDFFNPYSTIQDAVNHIFDINDGSSEYTIYLKNDVKHDGSYGYQVDISNTDASNPININISSYGSKTCKIYTTDTTGSESLFSIFGYSILSLNNLVLENDNDDSCGPTFVSMEGGSLNITNVVFKTISKDLKKEGPLTAMDYYNSGLKSKSNINIKDCTFFESDTTDFPIIYFKSLGTFSLSGTNSIRRIYTENPVTLAGDFNTESNIFIDFPTGAGSGTINYTVGKKVLMGDGLTANYSKFIAADSTYEIGSDGKLKKKAAAVIQLKDATVFSTNNVYTISTEEELVKLAQIVNGTHASIAKNSMENIVFQLVSDIDITSESFEPIGKGNSAFKGKFNGNGNLISNFVIDGSKTTANNYGLFGYVDTAEISNLNLSGKIINTNNQTGGLVSIAYDSKIHDCNVKVDISSSANSGGIFAKVIRSDVYNCINFGNIESSVNLGQTGGIGSYLSDNSSIINCANLGNVTSTYTGVDVYTGGICGVISDNSSINIAYNAGTVTGNLAGQFVGDGSSSHTFNGCWSIVSSGLKSNGNISDNTANYTTSTNIAGYLNGRINSYSGNYSSVLKTWGEYTYKVNSKNCPILSRVSFYAPVQLSTVESYDKLVEGGVYLISSQTEMIKLSEFYNSSTSRTNPVCFFKLTKPIDLTGIEFTPIGSQSCKFNGFFDGDGKLISGLNINASDKSNVGLFGYVSGGTIENLSVSGSVTGKSNVGGLVGYITGGVISGVSVPAYIQNCFINVTVVNGNSTTGTSFGGIAGLLQANVYIENCINIGDVHGVSCVGGLIGYFGGKSSIKNCSNLGDVYCSAQGSGIAFVSQGITPNLINIYNAGTIITSAESGCSAIMNLTPDSESKNIFYIDGVYNTIFSSGTYNDVIKISSSEADTSLRTSLNNYVDNDLNVNGETKYNSWTYTYTKDGVNYPVCLKPPVTSSSSEGSGYTSVSSISSYQDITSGSQLSVSDATDIKKISDWVINDKCSFSGVTFKLTDDIDFENTTFHGFGKAGGTAFQGTLDGGGKTIKNVILTTTQNSGSGIGLVNNAGDGCVVKNIVLDNVSFDSSLSGDLFRRGAIIGETAEGSTVIVINCIVNNFNETNSKNSIGGICGYNKNSTIIIRNCITSGIITAGTYAGGLVGYNTGVCKIENSASYCEITAKSGCGGGLVGSSSAPSAGSYIANSFFAGTIKVSSGSSLVGPVYYTKLDLSTDISKYVNVFYLDGCVDSSANSNYNLSTRVNSEFLVFTKSGNNYKYDSKDFIITLNEWVSNSGSSEYFMWREDSETGLLEF